MQGKRGGEKVVVNKKKMKEQFLIIREINSILDKEFMCY